MYLSTYKLMKIFIKLLVTLPDAPLPVCGVDSENGPIDLIITPTAPLFSTTDPTVRYFAPLL